MTITAGWTPLSGPKVPAEATNPNRMTGALLALPAPPIPSMRDDGFMADECCAPLSGCGTCGDTMAVNVSSGSLLYRYRIPENTIPIQLSYESDQPGETALGSKGWVSNLHRQITVGSVVVTVRCSDGCLVDYNQDPSNTLTFYPSAGMDNLVQKSTT